MPPWDFFRVFGCTLESGWNLRQGFYESVLKSSSPGLHRLFSLPGCRTRSLLKNPARAFQKPIPIRAHECGPKISFCNFCKGYFTIHSLRIMCPISVRSLFRKAMVSLQQMPVYNPSPLQPFTPEFSIASLTEVKCNIVTIVERYP